MGVEKKASKGKKDLKGQKKREISETRVYDPVGCLICLKEDHWCYSCPYLYKYPAGARVGRFAKIQCMCCGRENPHPGEPGVDWDAKCDLRDALEYPRFDEELKALGITSASLEGATAAAEQPKRIRGRKTHASDSEGGAYGTRMASGRIA